MVSIKELERAICDLHGCDSEWVESIPIKEMFGSEVVWEGVVQVFRLIGHPTSDICYTWSHEIEGSTKHKYIAVLRQDPVKTPADAVRAFIVSEYKKK